MDPIDITRLTSAERKRWHKVLDYLYNELPNDDAVMSTLLTKDQQDFVNFYQTKYGGDGKKKSGGSSGGSSSSVVTPPTNLASLSVGLTRFSFCLNNQMAQIAKRATRKFRFLDRR